MLLDSRDSGADAFVELSSDSDGYEFVIVSLDNKQWHFEAQSGEVSQPLNSFFLS